MLTTRPQVTDTHASDINKAQMTMPWPNITDMYTCTRLRLSSLTTSNTSTTVSYKYNRLTALCSKLPGWAGTWRRRIRTNNRVHWVAPSLWWWSSSLNFYRLDALPNARRTVSKHRKMPVINNTIIQGQSMLFTNCYSDDQLTTTVLWPLYRSTCVRRQLQLRSVRFCWCKVLLPTCSCWRPVHSDLAEDAGVLSPQHCYLHCLRTNCYSDEQYGSCYWNA